MKLEYIAETLDDSPCVLCRFFATMQPHASNTLELAAFCSSFCEMEHNKHYGHKDIPGLDRSALLAVASTFTYALQETDFICSYKGSLDSPQQSLVDRSVPKLPNSLGFKTS
jgi:hypothetical protein